MNTTYEFSNFIDLSVETKITYVERRSKSILRRALSSVLALGDVPGVRFTGPPLEAFLRLHGLFFLSRLIETHYYFYFCNV